LSIEKSTYPNYEVIVVENNSKPETFRYYENIAPTHKTSGTPSAETYEGTLPGGQRICVAVWKEAFNYSKLNNFGTGFARGDYFVLLNNDIEIITPDWLEGMLANCQRKNVGIVGAKLYYPDDTVQHAGIVVGIGGHVRGIAANMFVGLPRSRSGYFHKASLQMNYSAVTAACMMVSRKVYEQVNGFEEQLTVAFNDVDFCLKVRKAGYLIVYDPQVEAYHYESKSRGQEDTKEKVERFQREIEYMRSHWIGILKDGDPYYNPNFSHIYTNYSLKDNS
jgi:GT2 family glycosyltransferase